MATPTLTTTSTTTPPGIDFSQIGTGTTTTQSPTLAGDIGGWIKNNGSTIGSVVGGLAGAAFAPETGGLSLAIPALFSAGGAAAGNIASQAANGQNIGSSGSVKSDLGNAALGGVSDLTGGLIGKAIGKAGDIASTFLTKKGEGLALASSGITNGAAKTWGAANNEALSDFITRTGQIGDNAEQVAQTTDQMGKQYDAIARQSGEKIPLSEVKTSLDQMISDQGTPIGTESNSFVTRLENERDTIMQNLKPDAEGNIDIGQLADAKSEFQKVAYGNRATNPTGTNDVEQTVADTLMGKLNSVADDKNLTTPDGTSLSQLGQDLQKQSRYNTLVQKNAFASANAAKPITTGGVVRALSGGGAGFLAGGPVGAVAGSLAEPIVEAAANSPASLKILSGSATTAAPAIGNTLKTIGGAVGSPLGIAAQQLAGGSALSAGQTPTPPQSSPGISPPTPSMDLSSVGQDPLTSGVAALQAGQPLSQQQYQALLEKDLTTTGGRFSSQITAAYQAGNPSAVQGLGIASNAINTLNGLYQSAGGAKGLVTGNIENALAPITKGSVNTYNQQATALGQEIISQIYGSSGTAADRDQILSLIPQINDSPANAASKLSTLKALIQQRLSSMNSATPNSVSALTGGPSLTGTTP